MTFPKGRRLTLSRNNHNREGRESLLLNPESSGRYSHQGSSNYTSGGSTSGDSFEAARTTKSRATSASPVDSRLTPQSRFSQQQGSPRPDEGFLQFVPAFDEANMADASWDAIMNEGATAFPTQEPKSESASGKSRFRKKAQSIIGAGKSTGVPRRPSDAESSVSTRNKGPRIARLASLFAGSTNTPKPSAVNTSYDSKKFAAHNTTDPTLPSSPSRSSSSGGYVGWPGTQDKHGRTVAMEQSSYEESECQSNNDPPSRQNLPFENDFVTERQRREAQEWMQSPPFQDISGVMEDPDISGMTMPEPPGEKADDSLYFESEQQHSAMHTEPLFHNSNQAGWDDVHAQAHSSPSRSTFSKNSSAYFDNNVRPMAAPALEGERRRQAVAGVMRGMSTTPQPPTEAALALNNSFSPPTRTFHAAASRGFRGLLDKTQDVPNLMDGLDSDSLESSGRASSNVPSSFTSGPPAVYRDTRPSALMPRVREEDCMTRDSESDVFDEISKYSIGDSEPFEGISTSDSKQSMYEVRDANPFEGISQSVVQESKASLRELRETTSSVEKRHKERPNGSNVKVVLLGGGLTTIQTTNAAFSNRISASDFDECLTNSDIDEYGQIRIPSFKEMAAAGRSPNDNASVIDMPAPVGNSFSRDSKSNQSFESFDAPGRLSTSLLHEHTQNGGDDMVGQSFTAFEHENHQNSRRGIAGSDVYKDDESAFFSDFYSQDEVGCDGDLSEYYVQPSMVKRLVRKYRKMCRITMSNCQNYDELDRAEDEKKVFALFEMRSRIMEKDIERGLERRGGTSIVDDLVITPTNRRAMRVRDAVIVSKAWRDGAAPMDVINTARLTQRDQRSYFIKRRNHLPHRGSIKMPPYHWEEVAWTDDTDFMQYRCPSLGPRHLCGSEMYTIGDCQSILLKLTNEACIELREELNNATANQIEAEELMREEGDCGDGMMTESEMTYLTAMEEVKTISRKLVVSEKAFALVRDRIRNLVAKYESLLVKIDNEDLASSVITAESSCYSEDYGSRDFDEELAWQRRQQRAEVSAELAAREALLAKQSEERAVQEEKHRELRELQTRLVELQSEPSTATTDRQRSVVLAKAIAARKQQQLPTGPTATQNDNASQVSNVEGVKQRFRERMAARMRQKSNAGGGHQQPQVGRGNNGQDTTQHPGNRYFMQATPKPAVKSPALERQKLIRLAGEEMFQHLDFYERSLKAVETSREGAL